MFSVEQHGSAVVITPACDLDIATKAAFEAYLDTAGRSGDAPIVVCMLHCPYIDSSALNVLMLAKRTLGDRLSLVVDPNATIARVFSITSFYNVVPIYPTLIAALAASEASLVDDNVAIERERASS